MVILGLNIAAFGKLSNKEIPLRPGTNVITGDNESGKTTIAVFLKSMLYGMEEGDNVYERYYPFGFSGVYGGSLTILSEDRVYELKRSFLKSNPDLSITCTEDGEALEDPEGWLEENRGGLSRAEYEASGYIAQNALTRDAQWLEETGRLNEAEKLEADNRLHCMTALEELTGKKTSLEAEIDDTLSERAEKVFRAREEKELAIKELTSDLTAVRDDLNQRKTSLEQDIKSAEEANTRKTAALHSAMLQKKTQLSEFTEFNETALSKSTAPGIILMAVGFVLAAVSAFLWSSYRMEGIYQYLTIAGFLVTAALIAAGIILTVFRISRKNIALGRQSAERQYREDAEKAEEEYQYFVDHVDELGERAKDRPSREAAVRERETRVRDLTEQLEKEREERSLIDNEEQEYRGLLKKQEEVISEIGSVSEAISAMKKLGRLRGDGTDESFSTLAENWLRRIAGGREDSISVEEDGRIAYSGEGASLVPFRMNNSRAQEICLSLRLALFSSLDPEGRLPMILDDTFTDFDENRLEELMDLMKQNERQIIVLSCHSREKNTI